MKPQGHCIERCTPIRLPDGSAITGEIWQHRSGAKGIYAHIEGAFYCVQPLWRIETDEDDQPIYQGLGVPFPGNLVSGLRTAWWRWQKRREAKAE